MVGNSSMVCQFMEHIVQFLHQNNLWNDNTQITFKAILDSKELGSFIFYSEIFKIMVYYVQKIMVGDKTNIHNVIECILTILNENDASISTIFFNETFKDVVLNLIKDQETGTKEMIALWAQKSDEQSFFSFVKSIINEKKFQRQHLQCIKELSKVIDTQLDKLRPSEKFVKGCIQIIMATIAEISSSECQFKLSFLSYLFFKLRNKLPIKQNEMQAVNIVLIKLIDDSRSLSIQESFKVYKYCLKI